MKRPKVAIIDPNTLAAVGLKQMLLKNCSEETYDGWIAAFCKRKYNSDFSREMTRSVREYLKQFKDRKSE